MDDRWARGNLSFESKTVNKSRFLPFLESLFWREIAEKVHADIRAYLASFDADVAAGVRILYGGSCNAKTAPDLFKQPDIDGGLVGGASLKAPDFTAIIEAAEANA